MWLVMRVQHEQDPVALMLRTGSGTWELPKLWVRDGDEKALVDEFAQKWVSTDTQRVIP